MGRLTMETDCTLCYHRPALDGGELCDECQDWEDYWESLTDDERAAEIASMDRYGAREERV